MMKRLLKLLRTVVILGVSFLGTLGHAQTSLPVTPYNFLGASATTEVTASAALNSINGTNAVVGEDGFLRFISLQGQSNTSAGQLVFTQCTNQSCTTSISNTISSSGSVGCYFEGTTADPFSVAMTMDSSGFARIALLGPPCNSTTGNVVYIQCLTVSCSSSLSSVISTFGVTNDNVALVDLGIAMETDGITAVVMFENCHNTNACTVTDQFYIDESTCSAGSCTTPVDLVGPYAGATYELSSFGVYVGTDNNVRFAYSVWKPSSSLVYYYYDNGTSTTVASYAIGAFNSQPLAPAMGIASSNLATIAWPSITTAGTTVVGCENDLCTIDTQTTVLENLTAANVVFYSSESISVTVGSNGLTEILRGGTSGKLVAGPGAYDYIQCSNTTCSAYTLFNLASATPFLQTGAGARAGIITSGVNYNYAVGMTLVPGQNANCLTTNFTCNGYWELLFSTSLAPPPPPKYLSRTFSSLVGDSPSLQIPVLTKPGKESFSYTLFEAPTPFVVTNQWQIPVVMAGVPSPNLSLYTPIYPAVAQTTPLPSYSQSVNDSLSATVTSLTNGAPQNVQGWFFVDSSYVSHFFGVTGDASTTVAPDGSGYSIAAAGTTGICTTAPCPTLTDAAGNTLVMANNTSPTFDGVVAQFTDLSGITMTATFLGDTAQTVEYTDTLGVFAITAAQTNANSVPPSGALPTNTYTYTNASGTVETFTVTYGSFTQETAFGCAGIAEVPATPVFLPVSVSLPDGSSYTITYETTPGQAQTTVTGRLASVMVPTGATILYSYSGGNNGINCVDGSVPTLQVTTPDGTTTYVHTP